MAFGENRRCRSDLNSTEKPRHLFQRPLRSREADPLQPPPRESLKPLQSQGQMGSALGGNQGMNFVDDDGVNGAQSFGRLRSQQAGRATPAW